ncbi:Gcd10p-domain-containing protein [Melanomma pulvis-pyrius CBS 109.77]|uniref:tRNA (adenine(58)-N(1))-methyltransferase non-catalytic subunit TRM6 n=1 Tax=Melanomma pulvis-pyrius CBS 109.77 TaxID=1314802 RepID=A0A6A6WZC8_9PLEO|nr:Gcd10p-domain-containing protein [Melanomma pulvis-pyrius CBS 109.77]
MHSSIRPNAHVALRLPSGILKVLEIIPNTTINIGKFGTFPANHLLGRPYYLTYEVLDKDDGKSDPELNVVSASELHAEALGNDHAAPAEGKPEPAEGGAEFDIVGENGEVIMRSNRMTVDDPSRQTLSMDEIEELKKAGTGSGKEIIAKLMASHLAIDQKTSFSLAKYTLRKSRKYLKRFTVLPMDIGILTAHITEKEAYKIMELREETLGLICSWSNIHCAEVSRVQTAEDGISQIGGGRWLVVDDTGGLVTAALAEKMGLLYSADEEWEEGEEGEEKDVLPELEALGEVERKPSQPASCTLEAASNAPNQNGTDVEMADSESAAVHPPNGASPNPTGPSDPPLRPRKPPRPHIAQMSAETNTLTILHTNNQPNLSLLKYFSFDPGAPNPAHPLYTHLKSVSWLQLLYPTEDPSYIEPEVLSDDVLAAMKSSKRGNYYKKRRRWERTARVVDETRRGGYDGLVVASVMEPRTIMKELVPLVRGGGRIVVYHPNVEPLVDLCDLYSKERRTTYIDRQLEVAQNVKIKVEGEEEEEEEEEEEDRNGTSDELDEEDFPVNPTLLLVPTLQTSRARHWQVLPGRTHPMMTSHGGSEGYLFTATRVLPAEGRVEARGRFRGKKRKTGADSAVPT